MKFERAVLQNANVKYNLIFRIIQWNILNIWLYVLPGPVNLRYALSPVF